MPFFQGIAHWFEPLAAKYHMLHPLTEPGTIILIFIIGAIAVLYYISGSWFGGGGSEGGRGWGWSRNRYDDDYQDGYEDGREDQRYDDRY
jgi:hypothetical protein